MSMLTEALGGPVLAWELKRASRRILWRYVTFAYCAWLFIQVVVMFSAFRVAAPVFRDAWAADPPTRLDYQRIVHVQRVEFFDNYLVLLLQFQLVLILAIVPALTAGCLGQEKERGTLFALFGTQLTSLQILLGKLLGRLIPIVPLVFTTLPILVHTAAWTGRELMPVVLALAQQAIVAFGLGAACLLFAIWIRRTADAVIASYLFLALVYLMLRVYIANVPEVYWLDPVDNLRRLLKGESRMAFAGHLAFWALVAAICLRLGWGRLRKVCVEQRDKQPTRRLWAFRPAVGNDAIRWRECYVIGLAPLPILRMVPRWLALLGVMVFSTAVAGIMVDGITPGFTAALVKCDFAQAFERFWASRTHIVERVPIMGLVFIIWSSLLLAVRCGTSVAEEKRRNTWDDLLLTAQSFREITTGKMWGILQATLPYIIAYNLPVLILASLGGWVALFMVGMWVVLPCVIVLAAVLGGIDMVRVPPDMDETRSGGAFWFEKALAKRRR